MKSRAAAIIDWLDRRALAIDFRAIVGTMASNFNVPKKLASSR